MGGGGGGEVVTKGLKIPSDPGGAVIKEDQERP